MRVLLIAGSPSATSRTAALLQAAGQALQEQGLETEWLRLRELPAQALLHARFDDPAILQAQAKVAAAQAVVLATPIYKGAYAGILKTFLDLLPKNGLAGKWVWPLATGGSAAHTLSLDLSLKPVLDGLGTRQVVPSVYALDTEVQPRLEGLAEIAPDIQQRLVRSAGQLVQALETQERLQRWQPPGTPPASRRVAGLAEAVAAATGCSA